MQMQIESQSFAARLLPNPAGLALAHSVDEAITLVGRSLSAHRLSVCNGTPVALARLSALSLGECAMVSLQYGFDVDIDAGCIADYFMLKMTLAGEGRITSNERTAVTRPESIFVTSPVATTRFYMSAACQHLTTRICRRAIEERLMQKLASRLHDPLEFDLEIGSNTDFGRAWWQLIAHICDISATAPSVLASDEVRNQYSRTLMELLLHAAPHNYSERLRSAEAPAVPRHVRRAQEYVLTHLAEVRSVAEIGASIGVSPRTLQNGFKQALNMSPAEYVRQARVQALHRALLSADGSQSVTSLMASVGISSFGRYAEYYRQVIGTSPSETLRRAL